MLAQLGHKLINELHLLNRQGVANLQHLRKVVVEWAALESENDEGNEFGCLICDLDFVDVGTSHQVVTNCLFGCPL